MLDEAAKRKPNFDERNAAPVVLADGQTWYVPKPWLEVRPVFRGGKAVRAYPVLTCGPELDALIEASPRPMIGSRRSRRRVAGGSSPAWHYELDRRASWTSCWRSGLATRPR